MGALVQAHAAQLLDASTDQTAAAVRVSTGPFRLRQMTANGSSSAAGTEVATGGGYTSGVGAPTIAFGAAVPGATTTTSSTGTTSITNYPRAETVNGVEVWDSAGAPARKWWGALGSPKVMAAADTLSYPPGSVQLQAP